MFVDGEISGWGEQVAAKQSRCCRVYLGFFFVCVLFFCGPLCVATRSIRGFLFVCLFVGSWVNLTFSQHVTSILSAAVIVGDVKRT